MHSIDNYLFIEFVHQRMRTQLVVSPYKLQCNLDNYNYWMSLVVLQ